VNLQFCTIYAYPLAELTENLIPSWPTARRPDVFGTEFTTPLNRPAAIVLNRTIHHPTAVNRRQLQIRIEVIRRSRSTALHMRFYNCCSGKSDPSHSDKFTRATLPVVGSPPNPLHSLGGVEFLVGESKRALASTRET
jgi:hypothetical protein